MTQRTKEQFLKDVANHQMKILKDDDLYRHLRFKQTYSSYWFDLVTWPGMLVITGDMGEYMFGWESDVFNLFRRTEGELDLYYWGKQLKTKNGHKEFSFEKLKAFIETEIKEYFEDAQIQVSDEVIERIKNDALHESGADSCSPVSQIQDIFRRLFEYEFNEDGIKFSFHYDALCDANFEKPSYHYIWCLYAIVWGIQQYNKQKELICTI